jgi:predicted nucleic acid-binding Zn finger protein
MKDFQWSFLCNLKVDITDNVEEMFRALNFILCDERKLLEAAVEVLDSLQYIEQFSSGSSTGRHFWKVSGSKGNEYLCLQKFCTCRRYLELEKNDNTSEDTIVCKHLVAIQIAAMIPGKIKETVSPLLLSFFF